MKIRNLAAAALILPVQPVLAQSSKDDDTVILETMWPLIHCHAVVTITAEFYEAAKPEDTATLSYMHKKMADSRSVVIALIPPNKFDAAVFLESAKLRGEDSNGSLADKMRAYDGVSAEYSKCLDLMAN